MSRRQRSCGAMLAALACVGPLLGAPPAHADTCAGLSLAALAPAGVGTAPNAVAVGDFNRDGKMDVAVVNKGGGNVSILLGDGSGGFTAGPNSPIATGAPNPIDIATGDLDRDGILDLVVAFEGPPDRAEVLRGLWGVGGIDAGKFTAGGPFALAANPTRIYLAHFTNDADLDLVVLAENTRMILLYGGATGVAFGAAPLTSLDLSLPLPGESPSGAAAVDFDRDGDLDLAVTMRNTNLIRVYTGDGSGGLASGAVGATTGTGPRDVSAGDIDRDGWPDLVTADSGSASASVLFNLNGGSLTPQNSVLVGGVPTRVALVDLDHDGVLDLAALDDSTPPRVSAFRGLTVGPDRFDNAAAAASLPGSEAHGLAVGRFTADGRADLVSISALSVPPQVVVVENRSGKPCARSSFAGAPRSYPAGSGPVSSAAADFDKDGRKDLVVASTSDASLRVLKNVNGGFSSGPAIGPLSPAPRAVAVADMDVDGDMDVVVAQGAPGSGVVQVFLGDGVGGLTSFATQTAGNNLSALVIGDFNGDGAPDVASTSEGSAQVFVFLGNGSGGLASGTPFTVGAAPRALVAGFLDANATLDLAVANFGGNSVTVLFGNGNGFFGSPQTLIVGSGPRGIAAADVDGDAQLDLATADFGLSQVSVIRRNAVGDFLAAVGYTVGTNPTAVALVDLEGNPKPDIAVTSPTASGAQMLTVLANDGTGLFTTPGSEHAVRQAPQAITPIDADGDGLVDLAIPCRDGGSVVILVNRPPTLEAAPRVVVGDKPRAAVAGDFDSDGKLDLAVANSGGGSVSLLAGNGTGGLAVYGTLLVAAPEAIVAADFNRDGRLDLAVSSPDTVTPAPSVAIFFGVAGGSFTPQPLVNVGGSPDDLVAGDFDGDGDLDIALCDRVAPTGSVRILRNDGLGTFSVVAGVAVGNRPTAIVAADFDRDGDLDLAVANDDSDNVMFLTNTSGSFSVTQTLGLAGGDTSPVSLAAGDFDGNATIDLVAATAGTFKLHLYRNQAAALTPFVTPPIPLDTPYLLQAVAAADLTLDAQPELVALADGVSIRRGLGSMSFDPPQTVVARYSPSGAAIADFNRDGRPDIAVVNELSDDVSLLLSTTCQPQHLELSIQPSACSTGSFPFLLDAQVKAFDDGGNLAACADNSVTPSIVPGTGSGGAVLGGGGPLALLGGVATWTGGTALSINQPGRRFRLQFEASGLAPVQSRSFTLGLDTAEIVGPASVCPLSSGLYSLTPDPGYDSYAWSVDGSPFRFTPTATLANPPLALDQYHALGVTARVDGCEVTAPVRSIYFGNLAGVTLSILGGSSVCVNCIGGSAKAIETGGGTPASRQWGYRTVSGIGAPISLPGETGETYVLKGASFPGPGTYYVVVTTTPSCGTSQVSNEWTVTVVANVPSGEVQHIAASSRGGPSPLTGQNRLLWVNSTGTAEEIRIRWNKAPTGTTNCLPPATFSAPVSGEAVISSPLPSSKSDYLHASLELDTAYCYSVFVKVTGVYSPGRTVKARPFDSTVGPVKWAYATGGTAVAPPTVSGEGILAMSNDRTVHSLTRGSGGGEWPANWDPTGLMGVAHSRSPVVPFLVPLGSATSVLFAADDVGWVHAVDAATGQRPWPARGPSLAMTGAPGGMFTQYGGVRDLLFVGTRDVNVDNSLRALNLVDGTFLEAYAPGGFPGPIGPINGTPAIDYETKRIYFAAHTRGGGDTLFCLEITTPPAIPVLSYKWSRNLGNITGSPVLRGGRVYVGTDGPTGTIYSLDALNGLDDRTFDTFDGPVKGFLFPDRRNDDLFFATDTKVWSINGATMSENWQWPGAGNPSLVLFRPQTSYVYVGGPNGTLHQLDFSLPTTDPDFAKSLLLGGGVGAGQIGAPSLDREFNLLVVGSEPGVLYGVEVPLVP